MAAGRENLAISAAPRSDPRVKVTTLRDEPLVRFVVLGALVFAADRAVRAREEATPDAAHRIEISDAFVEGLLARHAARAGSGGEPAAEETLVREHVRDEVLYREAMARGLFEGDLIVRRRLVGAMELVLAAEVEVPEPDDAALGAYLSEHADALAEPRRTTLEHLFFSSTRGNHVRADALEALALLRGGASGEALGDAFLSGRRLGPATDARIDATLGAGIAERVAELPVGSWEGPMQGALGLHLVRIEARTERRVPTLDEARAEVRAAWEEAERARRTAAATETLVRAYEVTRTPELE